jgi:four helix bundle protein
MSANIAEGYGRFHFLDKNKFNYIARGSLFEGLDWTDKMFEREEISSKQRAWLIDNLNQLGKSLNSYIRITKESKNTAKENKN